MDKIFVDKIIEPVDNPFNSLSNAISRCIETSKRNDESVETTKENNKPKNDEAAEDEDSFYDAAKWATQQKLSLIHI